LVQVSHQPILCYNNLTMTLGTKRIIYGSFMLLFVIAAPILLLYASGFRYNYKKGSLQKTGVIFLETFPKNVEVSLNGKIVSQKTPLRIKNLNPNEYDLKISKQDYHIWQRPVNVISGATTFIQHIRLFKNNELPQEILSGSDLVIAKDKTANQAIILKNNDAQASTTMELFILQIDEAKLIEAGQVLVPLNIQSAGLKNGRVLLRSENEFSTFTLQDIYNPIKLSEIFNEKIIAANLLNSNSGFGLIVTKDGLWRTNLATFESTLIFKGEVISFDSDKESIIVVEKTAEENKLLHTVPLNDLGAATEIAELPLKTSSNLKIITGFRNHVLLLDEQQEVLYIINKEADRKNNPTEILTRVKKVAVQENSDEFLFSNDIEIWLYRTNTKKLLTRLGSGIDEILWYPVPTHLLFTSGNTKTLSILETVEASRRDKIDITDLDMINSVLINQKGDKVFFIARVGNQAGLFKLTIQ